MNLDEQKQPVPPQQPVQPTQSTDWQQPVAADANVVTAQPTEQVEPSAPHNEADVSTPEPLRPEPEQQEEMMTPAEPEGEDELVRWDAAEHVHREKTAVWFVAFAAVVVLLMAVAFFLMQSWSFAVLVPVMAAALFLYVQRPPAVNQYTLSRKGLHINDKLYPFDSFKEFGLVKDDDEHSVMLVPRKRFHAGVTVYFPEEVGEPLVDMLAARLPMREITLDPIERLIRALHI